MRKTLPNSGEAWSNPDLENRRHATSAGSPLRRPRRGRAVVSLGILFRVGVWVGGAPTPIPPKRVRIVAPYRLRSQTLIRPGYLRAVIR